MKKVEFINMVAKKSGLSRKDIEIVIEASLDTIIEALQRREKISFLGFGTFYPVKKNARDIKLPKSNKKMRVPEKYGVRFRAGKLLKEAVEKGEDKN